MGKSADATVTQLQQEYNTLLQKYAQAENTIDTLRIGAKIPIHVELTATGSAAGAGSMVGSSVMGSVASMGGMGGLSRHGSVASMVSSQLQQNVLPHHSASKLNNLRLAQIRCVWRGGGVISVVIYCHREQL